MPRWYQLDKHQSVVREWHPDNKKTIEQAKTPDREPVLWCCQEGHAYKERLTYRIHLGKGCPVCRGDIVLAEDDPSIADVCPELRGYPARYGFLAEDLLASADSYLVCPEGHEFIFWGSHPDKEQGCDRCQHKEFVDDCAQGFSPGEVFSSPIDYPGSLSEERLRDWPEAEGLQLYPPNTAIKLRERFFRWQFAVPDIVLRDTKVAVEYDDEAVHAGRQEKDQLKGQLLADAGWHLIRVRARGLQKINPWDISTASGPTRTAAREIATRVQSDK